MRRRGTKALPVTAALFFQLVSLIVSIAMVPLLLGFLGAEDYLVWAIFATIGGVTLQFEAAIQNLFIRRVAPLWVARRFRAARAELVRVRRAYAILSGGVLVVLIPFGLVYLAALLDLSLTREADMTPLLAWVLFIGAYALNYRLGTNNVILLSAGRTDPFYGTGTATRALNLLLSVSLLASGMDLLGLALAFALSVVVNVTVLALRARRVLLDGPAEGAEAAYPLAGGLDETGVVRFTSFMLCAYLLYRGAFLIAAGRMPTGDAASYGLALQAFAIFGAVAVIPLNVRLSRMAAAIAAHDVAAEDRELARSIIFAGLAIVLGACALVLLGAPILALIGSEVALPATPLLAIIALAFFVEALIMIAVNFLLLRRDFHFVTTYAVSALVGLGAAAAGISKGLPVVLALVALPLAVQAGMALPAVYAALARSRGQSLADLLRSIARAGLSARRP